MANVVNHSLFSVLLSELRSVKTDRSRFRELSNRAAYILAVEVSRGLQTAPIKVETPLMECFGAKLGRPVVLVPILRAGLGILEPFLTLLPEAAVGYIGLRRNEETVEAEEYLLSLPSIEGAEVILLDPMLATGGSAVAAVSRLVKQAPYSIRYVSVVAAPQGMQKLESTFPKVELTVGILDEGLNDKSFIVPGLGDYGDRLFNT